MNSKQFYQQLQQKLPDWQAQGWVTDEGAVKILDELKSGLNKTNKLGFILGMMGVILLGTGVISFFAANWQGMSKLIKLLILFGSNWGAYSIAAYCFKDQRYPAMGQAFLLLGLILFGSSIMLIAQMYHIEAHYPNGILLWAIGGLISAVIMRSEIVLVATLLLLLLWSATEIFEFRQIHWQFIVIWFVTAVYIIRQQFTTASHIAIISLFCWILFSFYSFSHYAAEGIILQLYLSSAIVLFMLARLLESYNCCNCFSELLSRYALFFALLFLYILSFPDVNYYRYSSYTGIEFTLWYGVNISLMLAAIILLIWTIIRRKLPMTRYKKLGILWLAVLFVTLLLNGYFHLDKQGWTVLMLNLLLFALVIWLIFAGLEEHKRFYVNIAFVLFAITLISRYFDTFWSLMNHSLFFIAGGLLLIVGGFWLEKQRRKLSQQAMQGEKP